MATQKHLWELNLQHEPWYEPADDLYDSWSAFLAARRPVNLDQGVPLVAFYWQQPKDFWNEVGLDPNNPYSTEDAYDAEEVAEFMSNPAAKHDILQLVFLTQSISAEYIDVIVDKCDEPLIIDFIRQHLFKGTRLQLE